MPKKKAEPRNCYVTVAVTAREKQVLQRLADGYEVSVHVLCRRVLAVAIRRLVQLQRERDQADKRDALCASLAPAASPDSSE